MFAVRMTRWLQVDTLPFRAAWASLLCEPRASEAVAAGDVVLGQVWQVRRRQLCAQPAQLCSTAMA